MAKPSSLEALAKWDRGRKEVKNMSERIYGQNFDQDPNTKKPNTSIRFIENAIQVNFGHEARLFKTKLGINGRVRTSFLVRAGDEPWLGLKGIHKSNPTVLPEVVSDLHRLREEQELTPEQHVLVDLAIRDLKDTIDPKDSETTESKPEVQEFLIFITRPPHPRTSSEAVDVGWFDYFRENGNKP